MFIDLHTAQSPAPFGGAERGWKGICQLEFRSSERRRKKFSFGTYKHVTSKEVIETRPFVG